jgi:hypothetical protein
MPDTLHAQNQHPTEAVPRVIYGEGADAGVTVDPEMAAQTMHELGIPDTAIADSAVFVDPKSRLLNNGTHYSKAQARLRFRSVPEIRDVKGDVIRISTKKRGKDRSEELMNKTATHEWEHMAQAERHDRKVTEGHIAIYGLAAVGALAGNRLGGGGVKRLVGLAVGGYLGYLLGYRVAPHERQARFRAGQVRGQEPQVVSRAIKRS